MEKVSGKSPRRCTPKKYRMKTPTRTKKDVLCTPVRTPKSLSDPFEDYQPSKGLFTEEDVEGKNVFQVTPLKLKNLSLKDKDSPSTKEVKTPTSQCKTSKEGSSYSLRHRERMKQELANLHTSNIESDPEDSDENDLSGDEENESEEEPRILVSSTKKKKHSGSLAETYFFAQKQKTVTSNRTLSNLKIGQTDIKELENILKNAPEYHKKEREALYRRYKSQFKKWICLLHEGFNLLLYGVGSKKYLLNEFCKNALTDSIYVTVHGYFPSLNLKQILSSITEEALEYDGKFSNTQEQLEYIKDRFSKGSEKLYVLIHNIDGIPLRSVKVQTVISSLAAIPNIHFVCSIDHINSPLIWDQVMMSQFCWVWRDVTTFEPYTIETSYESSILHEQSSHLLLSSLLHVFNSLTPNGRGVFLILAKRQFEEKGKNFSGMAFHEWYQDCRESFLVNSEITMQAQLSEFKNHKLLNARKNVDGIELWYIPVDDATLEQFLESSK